MSLPGRCRPRPMAGNRVLRGAWRLRLVALLGVHFLPVSRIGRAEAEQDAERGPAARPWTIHFKSYRGGQRALRWARAHEPAKTGPEAQAEPEPTLAAWSDGRNDSARREGTGILISSHLPTSVTVGQSQIHRVRSSIRDRDGSRPSGSRPACRCSDLGVQRPLVSPSPPSPVPRVPTHTVPSATRPITTAAFLRSCWCIFGATRKSGPPVLSLPPGDSTCAGGCMQLSVRGKDSRGRRCSMWRPHGGVKGTGDCKGLSPTLRTDAASPPRTTWKRLLHQEALRGTY